MNSMKALNALLLDYATVTAANNHRDELRQRSEKLFTEQFHRSLRGGCAEEILLRCDHTSNRPLNSRNGQRPDSGRHARRSVPAHRQTQCGRGLAAARRTPGHRQLDWSCRDEFRAARGPPGV